MKINLITDKKLNFLFFLLEISGLRKQYTFTKRSREWLKRIGPLSKEEKKLLKIFSKIIKKIKSGSINTVFLSSEGKVSLNDFFMKINEKDREVIKTILRRFEKKFQIIWEEQNHNFLKIKRYYIRNNIYIKKIISKLLKLCGIDRRKIKTLPIYLLLSSSNKNDFLARFSWSINPSIFLECSGWKIENRDKFLVAILIHEIFHIALRKNNKLIKLIKDYYIKSEKDLSKINKIFLNNFTSFEELIISSFIPEGYLSEKYLGIPIKKIALGKKIDVKNILDFSELRQRIAYLISPISKRYTEENKVLDKPFLNNLVSLLKK